ncbi:MAG: ribosome-binding factor A [Rickettsiales bacterium]|jgi:ribosome-binding factor A
MQKTKIKNLQKSQRQLQIGEQVKRVLAEIFMRDGVIKIKNGYITILQADVSPDAKNAKIFIDIFGGVDDKQILAELKTVSPQLRSKLAQKINLRYTPELAFVLDRTADKAMGIEDLIEQESRKFSPK